MFKEFILAIALGALLGFGLTGGYFAYKKSQSASPKDDNIPTPTLVDTQTTTPAESSTDDTVNSTHHLTIDSPEDEAIFSNSQVTVSGTTTADSYIIITTPTNTYFATASDKGSFSQEIEIDSGANIIQIDAIDPDDNQTSKSILVTYSTAKLE